MKTYIKIIIGLVLVIALFFVFCSYYPSLYRKDLFAELDTLAGTYTADDNNYDYVRLNYKDYDSLTLEVTDADTGSGTVKAVKGDKTEEIPFSLIRDKVTFKYDENSKNDAKYIRPDENTLLEMIEISRAARKGRNFTGYEIRIDEENKKEVISMEMYKSDKEGTKGKLKFPDLDKEYTYERGEDGILTCTDGKTTFILFDKDNTLYWGRAYTK